jgi:hypothetical protein
MFRGPAGKLVTMFALFVVFAFCGFSELGFDIAIFQKLLCNGPFG